MGCSTLDLRAIFTIDSSMIQPKIILNIFLSTKPICTSFFISMIFSLSTSPPIPYYHWFLGPGASPHAFTNVCVYSGSVSKYLVVTHSLVAFIQAYVYISSDSWWYMSYLIFLSCQIRRLFLTPRWAPVEGSALCSRPILGLIQLM